MSGVVVMTTRDTIERCLEQTWGKIRPWETLPKLPSRNAGVRGA